MKRYEVYRNIRKRAMIFGLPIGLFALMIISVIGSLLVIIFSFSLLVIVTSVLLNLTMYFLLIRITANPRLLKFQKVFPQVISNKKLSDLHYED